MSDLFSGIKNALDMVEVVCFYYGQPNRSGFVKCPFHNEKTPSCKIYRQRFQCFGCGASGDVIDFVARLLNLSPMDAAKRLNADFRLGLDLTPAPPDPERQRVQAAKRLFEEWKTEMLRQLDAAIRAANLADFSHLSDGEATALVYREALEYWAGILMHGNFENQMALFRDRKEVERLCRMILKPTQMRLNAS